MFQKTAESPISHLDFPFLNILQEVTPIEESEPVKDSEVELFVMDDLPDGHVLQDFNSLQIEQMNMTPKSINFDYLSPINISNTSSLASSYNSSFYIPQSLPNPTMERRPSQVYNETEDIDPLMTCTSPINIPSINRLAMNPLSFISTRPQTANSIATLSTSSPPTMHLPGTLSPNAHIEGTFACVCGKRYASLTALRNHAKLHTNRERNFVCETCKKAFLRKQDLKRHETTHIEGYHPYSCDNCGTTFTRSDALSRHLKARRCLDKDV